MVVAPRVDLEQVCREEDKGREGFVPEVIASVHWSGTDELLPPHFSSGTAKKQ